MLNKLQEVVGSLWMVWACAKQCPAAELARVKEENDVLSSTLHAANIAMLELEQQVAQLQEEVKAK